MNRARALPGAHPRSTAAERYRRLEDARRPYLERAREAARVTTPTLMPPEHADAHTELATPYQGVGARGVNNLANKLLLAQFPPNTPFFRLSLDDLVREEAAVADAEDGRAREASRTRAIERALRSAERQVMRLIETGFFRAGLHAALKQLIVAGNVLLHVPPEGGLRVFRLDRYVVRRDPMGRLIEMIVRESAPRALIAERLAEGDGRAAEFAATAAGPGETADLYTWLRRDERRGGWTVHQEAEGQIVPGAEGFYAGGALDWLPLRWSHVEGEDYGRGHVEEQIGDLKSLDGLMQAIVEGAAAASKVTVLVSPNGQTDAEALAEAENGAIIDGEAGDVSVLQAGKLNDFRVAFEATKTLTERLSFAFLLTSALKRDGAHVTAEQVRFVAGELEDALGGVYSVLAEELQKPLVGALVGHLATAGKLPATPSGVITPIIVTGLEAMGRDRDLARMERFLVFMKDLGALSKTPLGERLDVDALLARAGAAIGVSPEEAFRDQEPEPEREAKAAEPPRRTTRPKAAAPNRPDVAALAEALGASAFDPDALAAAAEAIGPALSARALRRDASQNSAGGADAAAAPTQD